MMRNPNSRPMNLNCLTVLDQSPPSMEDDVLKTTII